MTNPLKADSFKAILRSSIGPATLIAVLVITQPYWVKHSKNEGNDGGNVEFGQQLQAHVRQVASDQRANLDQLIIIEDLQRKNNDALREQNNLMRKWMNFDYCTTLAKNDDGRRACASILK